MKKQDDPLTLIGHLEELRKRIIISAIVLTIAFCLSCLWIKPVLSFLIRPIGTLTFISPGEAFVANITVAFFMALFVSFPFIIYQIWQFITSGLTEVERRYTRLFVFLSSALFILGLTFAYFVILPIALRFLLSFSSAYVIPMITISRYISFVGILALSFGIVFELPLAMTFLTQMGIITPEFLTVKRKYAIVIIFIASAFLTPPDCITQILMALPLLALYEISVFLSRLTYRIKNKQA